MPSLGGAELLILLAIVLLFFGAKRLPEMGRSLGRGVTEFKEGLTTKKEPEEEEEEEHPEAIEDIEEKERAKTRG
jgi:sec-independent protein translocase protein TatA